MTETVAYAELSWPQAQGRVAKGAPIFLPLGATEQHGRHLSMNVDGDRPYPGGCYGLAWSRGTRRAG